MPVTSTTLANDAGKYISDTLIERSNLIHKFSQVAEKVTLPAGMAKTAEFIKYNRTDVAVDRLSEGVTPDETPFTIAKQSITVEQWGLYIALTDVAIVTTKHPVLNEAIDLVADAVARTVDYNMAEALLDGANVQYWDGSRANRLALTATDYLNSDVLNKARADMDDKGAPAREGDFFYLLVDSWAVSDILSDAGTTGNTFYKAQVQAAAAGEKGFVRGHIGDWLGFRIIKSNFFPKFTRIATTGAPVAGAGGSLTGTVYHKVTRKSTQRGFEEDIQVEASTAMGGNNRLTFTPPATTGYVYNIYVGSATGDSNLYLAKENVRPGVATNVDTVPTSGATAPETPPAAVVVHAAFAVAAKAVDNLEIDELSSTGMITPAAPSDSDPLKQRRKIGSKWMHKAGIRTSDYLKRIEYASRY